MRLAERSTVRMAFAMRSRISPSRLNERTIRAPSTVSPMVCTIIVEPSNERLANWRTRRRMRPTRSAAIGSAVSATPAISGSRQIITTTNPISENRSRAKPCTTSCSESRTPLAENASRATNSLEWRSWK